MRIEQDKEKAWKEYLKRTKGAKEKMTRQQFMNYWYPSETVSGLQKAGVDKEMIRRLMGG